ncbi:amidohydrolase family protein [Nocardia vaccinii]|uniref:amidohydrolase family protein n=1 Tax=Nocardia vaccinii TaxID=1822 RepID=UPI000836BB67|nr:amidohydrolase family protein [Nocardia vaccinii]
MTATHERIELLPDPAPRDVEYTLISVDDHLVEPADMFDGRMPAKFADRAPKVVVQDDETEPWFYEGVMLPQAGSNAVVGQVDRSKVHDPMTFDDMRPGCYRVKDRIRDMDINGVWASANFPSIISGFCGRIFSTSKDQELGLAVTRAWNDWMAEEWYGPYPDRIIPIGITWLTDPAIGAAEIERNAARGFRSVTLPEQPHRLGFPSFHSGYWDPIFRACEETDTVVSLHVGSSGLNPIAPDAPPTVSTVLFPVTSMEACVDLVWSGLPIRFPKLKIVMAEGGIGWVPMVLDRLDYIVDHAGGPSYGYWYWADVTKGVDISASEVLRRNFFFAVLDDKSTLDIRHHIGIDNIMAEVDYPHGDSTWPDSQSHFVSILDKYPVEDIRKITHENAARVFRHPLPTISKP